MEIDLIDPRIPDEEDFNSGIEDIFDSKMLSTDMWTRKCEDKIRDIHGCRYALLVSSGTMAIDLLLRSVLGEKIGIDGGHTVECNPSKFIFQDFTWKSTHDIVKRISKENGVDIEYKNAERPSLLIDPDEVRGDPEHLSIVTQTFGNCSEEYETDLPFVIYDSAHSFGDPNAYGRGMGEIISFSPAKNVSGCEAGAIITNNTDVYSRAKEMRRYHGRLSEPNALFLYHNINNIFDVIEKNKETFNEYKQIGDELDFLSFQETEKSHTRSEIIMFYDPGDFHACSAALTQGPTEMQSIRSALSDITDVRQRYKKHHFSNHLYNNSVILPRTHDPDEIDMVIETIIEVFK